jgi:DNA-3-methyladenine glycosylase I
MPKSDNPQPVRCAWASGELLARYHDEEWGVPVHDDRTLFEFLILEGAQAGLSWNTILSKRENYRKAFAGFDPQKVARYDRRKIEQLLRKSRHRPQQTQNSLDHREREGVSRSAKRIWQLRPLHLAIRRRQAATQPAEVTQTNSRAIARLRCDE